MSRPVRRAVAIAATAAAALGVSLLVAGPASAATLTVAYHVKGTSTVAKTGSTITLGPTTLTTHVSPKDGSFTGTLPLPPTSTSFSVLGLLPVTATVSFLPSGTLTGQLHARPKVTVSATSSYTLQLSNVTVAGIPTPVGSQCETADPVSIAVATPTGKVFDLTKGGQVTGTYTIGNFADCGLTTALINLLVPGPNNTVSLNLTHGHVVT